MRSGPYLAVLFCLGCGPSPAIELVISSAEDLSSVRVSGTLDDGTALPAMQQALASVEGSVLLLLPDRWVGRSTSLVVEGLAGGSVVASWSGSIVIEPEVVRVAIALSPLLSPPLPPLIEGQALVDAAGPSCPFGSGAGTHDDPFCSISDAVAMTSTGTIVIAAGIYEEKVEITGVEKNLHLAARGTVILASAMSPALKIKGGARAAIEGLTITGSGGAGGGVRIEMGGSARFIAATIGPGSGIGIEAKDGDVIAERCRIVDNTKGGVSLEGGVHRIVNSVIARNGSDTSELGGALVGAGSELVNATVADNRAKPDRPAGVRCLQEVEIVSSIVWNNGLEAACRPRHSDLREPRDGEGNLSVDPRFADTDYHLSPDSPCIDAGDPAAAPAQDLDGEVAPSGGGIDMGADEVH